MAARSGSHHAQRQLKSVVWWLTSAVVIASVGLHSAWAQTTEPPWAEPVNLSRSGAATNPAIVVDSNSVMHVLWQDAFANYVYAQFADGQWSAPQLTNLHRRFGVPPIPEMPGQSEMPPGSSPNPVLVAGPDGHIFAFWITPEGKLYNSRALNSEIAESGGWEATKLLSTSAAAVAVVVDAAGNLQLAFLRTTATAASPAGIYYMRSSNYGLGWTAPVLLYASPYFQSLEAGEANLSLAATGTAEAPLLYLTWDNRSRKQLVLRISRDAGVSWEGPVSVAGPAPDSGLAGPFDARVGALDNQAVLVWQYGESGGQCTQFFRSSNDTGMTWSEPQLMFAGQSDCAQVNQFMPGQADNPGGLLYLLTNIGNQVFLSAWNGFRWTEPQPQTTLSGFADPETYASVVYGCLQPTWFQDRLYIAGCDQGAGGDIWVTARDVKVDASWFATPTWSPLATVTSTNLKVSDIDLVATRDNLIHAFVGQRGDPAIYYTRWDGTTWSRITTVMKVPDLEAGAPAIATGPDNALALLARSRTGLLFFSRANSADALTASNWSALFRLPVAHDGRVSQADIKWASDGTLYVVYSVAVNEQRGIYLTQSSDQGRTWSETVPVFDGAAAGFEVVGSPTLLVLENGLVHILWERESAPVEGVAQTLSLYYARSEDAGGTFSEAEQVAAESVTWQALTADGRGNLHRLWQSPDLLTTIWDQVSLDGGLNWESAQRLPTEGGRAAITRDAAGQLQLISGSAGSFGHWLWDGSRWESQTPLRWGAGAQAGGQTEALAAAITLDGKLVVVLTDPAEAGDTAAQRLLFATRSLDLPSPEIVAQATPTRLPPAATQEASPTLAELTSTPTAEREPQLTAVPVKDSGGDSPITQYATALWPVALLLLASLGGWALRVMWVKAR
jgi:hypothetical protein